MQLTRRETRLAIAAGAGLALLAAYVQWISPTLARMETLERVIPEKRAALEEMRTEAKALEEIRQRAAEITRQAKSGGEDGLLADVEAALRKNQLSAAGELTLRSAAGDGGWSEAIVGVELKQVSFGQIVKFLEEVKAGKAGVRVNSLHIRRNAEGGAWGLDLTAEISSLCGGADGV